MKKMSKPVTLFVLFYMAFLHGTQINADNLCERIAITLVGLFLPKSANVYDDVINQVNKNDDSKVVVKEVSSILKQSGEEMKTLGVNLSAIAGCVGAGILSTTAISDYISPSCTADEFHSRISGFSPSYPYRILGYAVGAGLLVAGITVYSIGSIIADDESFQEEPLNRPLPSPDVAKSYILR